MPRVTVDPVLYKSDDETKECVIYHDMGGYAANCFNHYWETNNQTDGCTVVSIIVDLEYIHAKYPNEHQNICDLFKSAYLNKFKEFTCKIEYFDGKIENITGVIGVVDVDAEYNNTIWNFQFKIFKIDLKYRRIKTITFKKQ